MPEDQLQTLSLHNDSTNPSQDADFDPVKTTREGPQPPSKPLKAQLHTSVSPSSAMPLKRAGTLSWQQRPASRETRTPKSRPLSMVAFGNNSAKVTREEAHSPDVHHDDLSKSQIAQSLASRDPSWFKQTQERGMGSAALRKNQVEDDSIMQPRKTSLRLPGMSRESTVDPESRASPPPDSIPPGALFQDDSTRARLESGHDRLDSDSVSSRSDRRSLLPTVAGPRFEPPQSDSLSSSSNHVSSAFRGQGRISPERMDRSGSPTKGLGGFVQSAMLKRSDSVNKRWSAQAGPGLSRGNSITRNLNGYAGTRPQLGGVTPLHESGPTIASREGSPVPTSRPVSSHSNAANVENRKEHDRLELSESQRNLAKLTTPVLKENQILPPVERMMSPPASPNKRWSPTKSSWLENAINKPESPRMKSPAPQQPAWMTELNRAKQERSSVDIGKGSSFKEVAPGGSIRSPPPKIEPKPLTTNGLSSDSAGAALKKPRVGEADEVKRKGNPICTTNTDHASQKPSSVGMSDNDQPNMGTDFSEGKPIVPSTIKPSTSPKVTNRAVSGEKPPKVSPRTKPKPETPPKKDLKSSLKPRRVSHEGKSKEEPEFRNVFGNLKRTHTKNYVAPNELKDNIMRGKAGLAQTGGPQKSQHKDEFKESILQKKQGMVTPSASTRITSASSSAQEKSTPEAIAKQKRLTTSDSIQGSDVSEVNNTTGAPKVLAKPQFDKPKTKRLEEQVDHSLAFQKKGMTEHPLSSGFPASLAGVLQRGLSPLAGNTPSRSSSSKHQTQSLVTAQGPEGISGGPQLTHATKARARGPKRRLPTTSNKDVVLDVPKAGPTKSPNISTVIYQTPVSPPDLDTSEPRPLFNSTQRNDHNRKPPQMLSPRKSSKTIALPPDVSKPTSIRQTAPKDTRPQIVQEKPVISPKVSQARQPSLSSKMALSEAPVTKLSLRSPQPIPITPIEGIQNGESDHQDSAPPLPSVKNAAAQWGQSSKPSLSDRAKSPAESFTRKDENDSIQKAELQSKNITRPDVEADVEHVHTPSNGNQPPKTSRSPKSPPLPGKKPPDIANRVSSVTMTSPIRTQPQQPQIAQPLHIGALLADIFDDLSTSKTTISVNTQTVLDSCSSKDSTDKIKTLRKQIFEIVENDKVAQVPTQHEHILFDQSIYLCSHVFGGRTGQRTTEVYLWCGDSAPASAVEDSHLFARKFAKDNGGKLVIQKQGKESTNFFQALGGIVITRRGSVGAAGPSVGSGRIYMLCGRQHVGQIAFDEVDYDPASLCPGFPFILSTAGGKLYLWKGSGSGADELGCARLIGMDLGATGEIEEIEEGHEPDAFWQVFPKGKQEQPMKSSTTPSYWHLKPSRENYITRLFQVSLETQRPKSASGFIQGAMQWGRRGSAPAGDPETARPAQIREIAPFAQSDLSYDGAFVLDAYFEVFV